MTLDEIPENLIVKIDDVRKIGHCVSGQRAWAESQGIDFRTFVRDGVSARELFKTGDLRAERAVRAAMNREASRG